MPPDFHHFSGQDRGASLLSREHQHIPRTFGDFSSVIRDARAGKGTASKLSRTSPLGLSAVATSDHGFTSLESVPPASGSRSGRKVEWSLAASGGR